MRRLVLSLVVLFWAAPLQAATVTWSISGTIAQIDADYVDALLSLELALGGETYAFSEDGSAPAAAGQSDFNDVFLNDEPGSDFVDFASLDITTSPSGGDYALEQFSVDVFSTLPGFISSLVLSDDPFDTALFESGSFAWIFIDVDGATVQQDLLIGTVTAASFSVVPAPPAALLSGLVLVGIASGARLRR